MRVIKIKDLPFDDRPREKLIKNGPASLSDSELIAILLRTGTAGVSVIQVAQNLIMRYQNINFLASQSLDSLTKNHGIGKDKAATLIAAFELSRRIDSQKKWSWDNKINSPENVAEIFIPILRDETKEKFIVVCLSSSNRIIKYEIVSVGNLNSSIVHPREIFKIAIDNNSASIILLHNHPSGNPEPSREDIDITKKIIESGNILGIKVLDHIIIAGGKYKSLVNVG